MDTSKFYLAQKYGIAYLNVFKCELTIEDIFKVDKLVSFLKEHKQDLFYIQLFDNKSPYFKQAIYDLFASFGLKEDFNIIPDVLLKDSRLYLIIELLEFISLEYKNQEKISSFIIESTKELSKEELERLVKFLENKTNTKVYYKTKINPKLIAGIKMYSNNYLWDYSVLQKLKNLDSYIWK